MGLRGVSVEHAKSVFFLAFSPESGQKAVRLCFGERSAVNPAIKFGQSHRIHLPGSKDMDIGRPKLPGPYRRRGIIVMISRGNEYGNGGLLQRVFQGLQAFPGGNPVKQVAAEQDQIAAFFLCGSCDPAGQGKQRLAQKSSL